MRELEAQALALAPVIAAAIAKALKPLQESLSQKEQQIDALHKRLDELPAPETPDLEAIAKLVQLPEVRHGKDAAEVDLDALAKAAATLVELPEVRHGKDAAEVDLAALAKAAAALIEVPQAIAPDLEAIAALVKLPVVKDGKDAAEVDLAAVAALVEVPAPEKVDIEAIARAAAALIQVPEVREPEHGRDALELEVLPAIDETKQYARGTYAAFRGGLWRSYERTHGMRGWECIVDGVDGVAVTQDSERAFSVTLTKSSGATVAEKFEMPIQIYKGVHRDGDEYEAHDTVTWGGSQWVSNKSANADKPGSNDSWTLCVKAGRPGKDLRENASTFDPTKGVKL